MAAEDVVAGEVALAAGRWEEARAAFETALTHDQDPAAFIGLASALWWLGDSHGSVRNGMRAYARFRQVGDTDRAVECAVWLAITYKANFGNSAAANGWSRRADRLLTGVDWVRCTAGVGSPPPTACPTSSERSASPSRRSRSPGRRATPISS